MVRSFPLLSLVTLLLFFVPPGGSAVAEEADLSDTLDRIERRRFFVTSLERDLPGAGFTELWERLLEASAATARAAPTDERAGRVNREILLATVRARLARGRMEEALAGLRRLVEEGPATESFVRAARWAAEIHEQRARQAEDPDRIHRNLLAALELRKRVGDRPEADRLRGEILTSEGRRAAEDLAAERRESAFRRLTDLEEALGSLEGEPRALLDRLRSETGRISIERVPGTPVGEPLADATLRVVDLEGGLVFSGPVEELRLPVDRYVLRVMIGETPVLVLPIDLSPEGITLEVPERRPPGMVYVPGSAGSPPFFIDRREVTVAEVLRIDPDFRPRFRQPELPAHDVPHAQAEEWARRMGKELPTLAQWRRATFGDDERKYPWGDEPPEQRAAIGLGRPRPVGSLPAGESALGLLDAAGNVWEWLRNGWAIGGGYNRGILEWDQGSFQFDFLRDPKPGKAAFELLPREQQARYSHYRIQPENLAEVGFRGVIEVPR